MTKNIKGQYETIGTITIEEKSPEYVKRSERGGIMRENKEKAGCAKSHKEEKESLKENIKLLIDKIDNTKILSIIYSSVLCIATKNKDDTQQLKRIYAFLDGYLND